MLITFANSLDPNQTRHIVRPALGPNCLTLLITFAYSLDPDQVDILLGLIWIQTVRYSGRINSLNAYPVRHIVRISKGVKIRNRYNQVSHLTQDTNGKVTNSQLDTTNESQEVSPFPGLILIQTVWRSGHIHLLITFANSLDQHLFDALITPIC